MNYSQAINFIKQRRLNDVLSGEIAYSEALKANEALKNADKIYRNEVLNSLKTGDMSSCDIAKKNLDELVEKLGLKNKFYPPFHCDKCKDTGFVNDSYCECVKSLALNDENIHFSLHSFSEINFDLFDDAGKNLMQPLSKSLMSYCEKFPHTNKKNIALLGNAGTGKTFFASCVADYIVKKGYSVVFVTAFEFASRAAKYHTTFDSTRDSIFMPFIDCDMLILDDLGTESIYKNVTIEYLYNVINERQLASKHTFLTSNLSIDEVAVRYGERIASRIFDKRLSFVREFSFKDIRKINL